MDRAKLAERRFAVQARAVDNGEAAPAELWVEGYAVRFSSPTVLFEMDGAEYREQISPGAFEEANMADVIFNYNHQGKVMARTRNGTLQLSVDGEGLLVRARLDGTEEGRRMYEEISRGYVDRMSFSFTIREESYDPEERMWTVHKCKRLYDVSAVDIPAYDDTSIEARRTAVLGAQEQRRHMAAVMLARRRLALKTKL